MKHIKRIIAILLCLSIVMNIAISTVFAEDATLISQLSTAKADVKGLREKCQGIEADLAALETLISAHSAECKNGACSIDEIVRDHQQQCANAAAFRTEINVLETKIDELENADKIDAQEIAELEAEIAELKTGRPHYGGEVILAAIAS